jgi:hypothetical protein
VADGKDSHRSGLIVDAVQDAVRAGLAVHGDGVVSQGWAEPFPDAVRVLEQRTGDELERGGCNGLGKVFGQVGLGGSKLHHEVLIAHDGDGLFEHGQVIWEEQDG